MLRSQDIYNQTENIYTAVKACRQHSRGKVDKIEYNGEMLAISVIAKRERITITTLTNFYKKIGNIYEAVKQCKEKAKARKERVEQIECEKIDYKGQRLTLREIAKIEKLDVSELRKYFNDIKDINKSIFVAKYQKLKSQVVQMEGTTLDLYDLSLLIGVKYRDLINLLDQGICINEIKGKQVNQYPGENIKMEDGTTLLEFCVKKGLNYTYMYRAMHTYGKKLTEPEIENQKNDDFIPNAWIHEKYNSILDMLQLTPFQLAVIIGEMSKRKLSLDEAFETCTLRKHARKYGITVEMADALYSLIKTRRMIGDEFQSEIHITKNEIEFINEIEEELSELRRKLQTKVTPTVLQKDDEEQDL